METLLILEFVVDSKIPEHPRISATHLFKQVLRNTYIHLGAYIVPRSGNCAYRSSAVADIQIAGYEEPLPSPERVDLMKEVKTHDIVTKNKPAVAILYPPTVPLESCTTNYRVHVRVSGNCC